MAPHVYPDTDSPFSPLFASEPMPCRLGHAEDVMMLVFRCYRLESVDGINWNRERWWHKLTHVCRTWRYLILSHPSHLDLHLVCTYETPIIDMLTVSPFRFIINYPSQNAKLTTEDEEGLLFALRHRNRVSRISIVAMDINYNKFLAAMDGDFPELRHLRITSGIKNKPASIIPTTFRAPHLSSLALIGATHPTGAILSLKTITAIHLVRLIIRDISPSPDFHPEYIVTQLSCMPRLATVSLGFRSPIPSRVVEKQLSNLPITRITLSHLTEVRFRGVSSFLEGLLARISAPLLGKLSITFFNQLTFSLPHLSRLIGTMPRLKHPVARVHLKKFSISIIVDDNRLPRHPHFLCITIGCQYHGWQIAAAAQICNTVAPVLSLAQELTLRFRKPGISSNKEDEVNLVNWYDLLRSFARTEILRVHPRLIRELYCALQLHAGECLPDVLPQLCELALPSRRDMGEAFVALLNARRSADRLVRLRLPGQLPIDEVPPRDSAYAEPKIASISPMGHVSPISRNSSPPYTTCALDSRLGPSRAPAVRDAINHADRTTVHHKDP